MGTSLGTLWYILNAAAMETVFLECFKNAVEKCYALMLTMGEKGIINSLGNHLRRERENKTRKQHTKNTNSDSYTWVGSFFFQFPAFFIFSIKDMDTDIIKKRVSI